MTELSHVLYCIQTAAEYGKTSIPYIVGGIPRDKLLGITNNFTDIDITTGDRTIKRLATELVRVLGDTPFTFKVMSDGHVRFVIDNWKVDLSSNFIVPRIKEILTDMDIPRISPMKEEVYSRDFTINTCLMPLGLTDVIDVTGEAFRDIKARIIKTNLHPRITLGYDPKRIVRAIYFASKLDFAIDPEIISWVSENSQVIQQVTPAYCVKKINKAIAYNKPMTIQLIKEMNLINVLPDAVLKLFY